MESFLQYIFFCISDLAIVELVDDNASGVGIFIIGCLFRNARNQPSAGQLFLNPSEPERILEKDDPKQ